jgi:Delta24-sterol reductase
MASIRSSPEKSGNGLLGSVPMKTVHDEVVGKVSAAAKCFFDRGEPFRIFHGSTNSTRPAHGSQVVDISALSNILDVDTSCRIATVEPNVPMDKLIEATLPHGLMPPVVMEFPGITVGGGFAGSAGESSSFKYGSFDSIVRSIEMVLANGDVVTASGTERPELFKGAAGSLGTLGIVTKLELRLVPAKRFVKLTYTPYSTVQATVMAIRHATEGPENDFVDGIIFSKSHGLVMTGQLTDDIPPSATLRTFSRARDPWFYLHAAAKPTDAPSVDCIPLAEYLFRYDRGGFWVGAEAFRYFRFMPFNRLTRRLLNDLMHTRMMYRAVHGDITFGYMIQDLSLPYSTVEKFIDYTSEELDIWPLWLCPLPAIEPPTFHPCSIDHKDGSQPMLNVGLWGRASKDMEVFVRQNRDMETYLAELGGRKVLYAHTYYPEDEFWQLYDRDWYQVLRERYSATALPTVYDKVKVNAPARRHGLRSTWPLAGVIGAWRAIRSRDYRLHRQATWMYEEEAKIA